MAFKYINSKQIIEVTAAPLCLENVSKKMSADNMKKVEIVGYVYDFSVDYFSVDVDDTLNIHKYLMKKHDIKYLDLLKKCFSSSSVV